MLAVYHTQYDNCTPLSLQVRTAALRAGQRSRGVPLGTRSGTPRLRRIPRRTGCGSVAPRTPSGVPLGMRSGCVPRGPQVPRGATVPPGLRLWRGRLSAYRAVRGPTVLPAVHRRAGFAPLRSAPAQGGALESCYARTQCAQRRTHPHTATRAHECAFPGSGPEQLKQAWPEAASHRAARRPDKCRLGPPR